MNNTIVMKGMGMNTKDELWNKRFSESTRSIAFQLQLSHLQCVMLVKLLQRDKYEKKRKYCCDWSF